MTAPDLPDDLAAQWNAITTGVAHTQRRIDQWIERAGVPPQWLTVLRALLLADDHRLPMNVLARDASMTSGGFTKLADRMARDGVIDRRGSEADRRVVNAALTPAGVELAGRAVRSYDEALRACLTSVVAPDDVAAASRTAIQLSAANAVDLSDELADLTGLTVAASERPPDLLERRHTGRDS